MGRVHQWQESPPVPKLRIPSSRCKQRASDGGGGLLTCLEFFRHHEQGRLLSEGGGTVYCSPIGGSLHSSLTYFWRIAKPTFVVPLLRNGNGFGK